MRLDVYTHYIPSKFLERMNKVAGDHKDIGKRMRGIPAIYDLDVRKKVIDQFKDKDYAQIISYAMPPIEHFAKGDDILEYLKLINDGFAEMCEKEPGYFPGWIAQVSLAIPDSQHQGSRTRAEEGRARHSDLHQRQRRPDRRPAISPVLGAHERAQVPDLGASLARRQPPRLHHREEVAL